VGSSDLGVKGFFFIVCYLLIKTLGETAENVAAVVESLCTNENINLSNAITFCTDGAANMSGRKSGASIRLHQKFDIKPVICDVHSIMLSIVKGYENPEIPLLVQVHNFVSLINLFF
jgi:hypothetical protein